MKLTRFELTYCGEPQGIGLIQGLKDLGMSEEKIDDLIRVFDKDLVIPSFSSFELDARSFYAASFFTEEGLQKFKKECEAIFKFIERENSDWEVETRIEELADEDARILYSDKYQALIKLDREYE